MISRIKVFFDYGGESENITCRMDVDLPELITHYLWVSDCGGTRSVDVKALFPAPMQWLSLEIYSTLGAQVLCCCKSCEPFRLHREVQ